MPGRERGRSRSTGPRDYFRISTAGLILALNLMVVVVGRVGAD